MYSDKIPVGYLSVQRAFIKTAQIIGAVASVGTATDDPGKPFQFAHENLAAGDILRDLRSGFLAAFVFDAKINKDYWIEPTNWEADPFPERCFLSATILSEGDHGLGKFKGSTPLVRLVEFETWKLGIARDQLFDDLAQGLTNPKEAEAKAKTVGVVLLDQPDESKFDPMTESHWTIPMAVSWIAWETISRTRAAWDKYRQERKSFIPFENVRIAGDSQPRTIWLPKPLSPASISDLHGSVEQALWQNRSDMQLDEPMKMPILQAQEKLWRGLQAGKLQAVGRAASSHSAYKEIPTSRWLGMKEIVRGKQTPIYVDEEISWHDVLIERVPLQKLASALNGTSQKQVPLDQNTAVKFLREHIDQCIKDGKRTNEDEELNLLRAAYPDRQIGRDPFREARKIAARQAQKTSWTRPGPKIQRSKS